MDTDSLYLAALSEEKLENNILPEKRNEWEAIRSRDCTDSFTVNATSNFFPRTCCSAHKKHDSRERVFLMKSSIVRKFCAWVAKPIVATVERVTSTNSVAGDSLKELWKTVEMGLCQSMAKYQKRQSTLLQPTEDSEH